MAFLLKSTDRFLNFTCERNVEVESSFTNSEDHCRSLNMSWDSDSDDDSSGLIDPVFDFVLSRTVISTGRNRNKNLDTEYSDDEFSDKDDSILFLDTGFENNTEEKEQFSEPYLNDEIETNSSPFNFKSKIKVGLNYIFNRANEPPRKACQQKCTKEVYLKAANEKWKLFMENVEEQPKQPGRVSFLPSPHLAEIHFFEPEEQEAYDFSYLDRLHFRHRIDVFEPILAPFLSFEHREKVLQRYNFSN